MRRYFNGIYDNVADLNIYIYLYIIIAYRRIKFENLKKTLFDNDKTSFVWWREIITLRFEFLKTNDLLLLDLKNLYLDSVYDLKFRSVSHSPDEKSI